MDDLQEIRRQIRTLVQYAAPEEHVETALDLLLIFRDDRVALMVLQEFYSYLPEAEDDWIRELRLVGRKAGVFLLAAVTPRDAYLYLVSHDGIEFHGSLNEGYLDKKLLDFFDFASTEIFEEAAGNIENFSVCQPLQGDEDVCPACHTTTGEAHELGCPVEVCPWCGGQLIGCHCRFEQLDLEEIAGEQELVRFEELLEEKGRIVYAPEQRPSFADEGGGVEFE
jgi:hypothetical protein